MAVRNFDPKLVKRAIKGFLSLAHRYRGFRFKLGEFFIVPKVVIVCYAPGDCIVLDAFSKYIEKVHGVIFDVIGLHEKYATQIEIYDDGRVVMSPSVKRSWDKVENLLHLLARG